LSGSIDPTLPIHDELWDNRAMKRLDLTLPTPEENIALDEALLDLAEEASTSDEYVRIWEATRPMVVLGRSSRLGLEVDEQACRSRDVPILRRSSGGAAIIAGPGCLMYALVLSHDARPELKDIGRAHAFVLNQLVASMRRRLMNKGDVSCAGTSDLVFLERDDEGLARKFSGNSMRMKRTHLLYHGTLLYDFDLKLIDSCLKAPPRQPDYRGGRSHENFVTNLPVPRQSLVDAIDDAWATDGDLLAWPRTIVAEIVRERIGRDSWTREFA
jgi:lipoate-protein ligase A